MAEAAPVPVRLHLRETGAGSPILLLHGLGGNHTVWNAVLEPLAEAHQVLAPDLRGHGRSPLPDGSTLAFDEIVADLEAVLEARNLSSTHVVGLSAGAFVALWWAARRPERFRSLVLCGGATHCDGHTRAVGEHWMEVRDREGPEAYGLRVLKDLYAADWIEAHMDLAERIRDDLAAQDVRGAALWARSVRSFDLRGRLGRFRVPTLALQGMDDKVVDSSHARLLRQSIVGAEFRLFPNTGHMAPVERPAETAAAIRAWVEAHETASPAATPGAPA